MSGNSEDNKSDDKSSNLSLFRWRAIGQRMKLWPIRHRIDKLVGISRLDKETSSHLAQPQASLLLYSMMLVSQCKMFHYIEHTTR
jgi:hypothetical protein